MSRRRRDTSGGGDRKPHRHAPRESDDAPCVRGDGDRRGVDVTIYRASVRHGDDYVSVPVVAPAGVDERERVRSLVGAVSHEK